MSSAIDLASLIRPTPPQLTRNDGIVVIETPPEHKVSIQANAQSRRNVRGNVLRYDKKNDISGGGSGGSWKIMTDYTIGIEDSGSPSNDQAENDALKSVAPFNLFFPRDADVRPDDRVGCPGWFNAWRAKSYRIGEYVVPTSRTGNGHYYIVIKAGASSVEPSLASGNDWPTTPGATVQSGQVTFKEAGLAEFYELVGTNQHLTNDQELVVAAKKVI